MNENKSDIYKVLEFIRENYKKSHMTNFWEWAEDEFPADFKKFQEDNYDGPSDGEAWSGGIADNH